MKNFKGLLIAFLVGVTIFATVKYVTIAREKNSLQQAVDEIKGQIQVLETNNQVLTVEVQKGQELKQELTQENTALKETLKTAQEQLSKLNSDLAQAQGSLDQLSSKFSLLKEENISLRTRNSDLKIDLNKTSQDNEALKVRLSTAAELKKALKELKRQARKVVVSIIHKVERKEGGEGNRGFIIKAGKPTYPAKVKIEVTPAPTTP